MEPNSLQDTYTNSVVHRFVLNSTFQTWQITFMHGIYAGKWSTHWIINSFLSWFIYRYVVRQACIIFVEVRKPLDYKLSSFSWRVSNPLFFTKHYRCVVLHASCPMGPPNNCHQVQSGNWPFKIRPKKKKSKRGFGWDLFLSWFERGYPSVQAESTVILCYRTIDKWIHKEFYSNSMGKRYD